MTDNNLYKNQPRAILEKLRDLMTDEIKVFFDGDPVIVGASQLPAVIVDWEVAEPQSAPTGHDKWQNRIVIMLLRNKMDDIGKVEKESGSNKIIETPSKKWLERQVFGRDADTGLYIPDTVLGILSKYFTVGGRIPGKNMTVAFGNTQRPGSGDTVVTYECHVTISANELIQVLNRT